MTIHHTAGKGKEDAAIEIFSFQGPAVNYLSPTAHKTATQQNC